MARTFIDGFESGNLSLWNLYDNAMSVVSTSGLGFVGDGCVRISYTYIYRILPAPATELYVAFKWRPDSTSSSGSVVAFKDGALDKMRISARNPGILFCNLGSASGDKDSTGSGTFKRETVHLVEVYYKISDTVGTITVKLDGVEVMDFDGDTNYSGTARFDAVYFGDTDDGYVSGYVDDVVFDDSTWPGDTRIQAIKATGDVTTTEWTPSTGANWNCIDETPASSSDYVTVNANDKIDLYTLANLVGNISSVVCVQVQASAKYEGSPTPTKLALVARSGGTNYTSSDITMTTALTEYVNLWTQNPDGPAAWDETNVNALAIGIKSRA